MAKSPEGGLDEHGNTSPEYDALRAALGRITAGLPTGSRGAANVTPARVVLPLTSEENFHPRTESIFSNARSPIITASKLREATRDKETPNPPAVGFGYSGGENGERRTFQGGVSQGLVSGDFLPDPAFNELLHRMKVAGDNFGNEGRGENYDVSANDAGIFHYLPSTHTQVSPTELPERFRAGRESSSEVRNVTVRDSKRTKSRTRDDEYKRRVSISSSTVLYQKKKSTKALQIRLYRTITRGVSRIAQANFFHRLILAQMQFLEEAEIITNSSGDSPLLKCLQRGEIVTVDRTSREGTIHLTKAFHPFRGVLHL